MLIMNHYHENPNIFRSTQISNISSCISRAYPYYIYRGKKDQYGLREKEGYNEKKTDDSCEIYEGNFIYDNQHGNGVYRWTSDKGKTVYEGHIYCNSLHGYGRFSYPDGSVFEGLYKDNRRYGPGVLTESDGKQSVGIWRNKKLTKLTVKVETGVPILGTTPNGKAKVNWFKNVVPINKTIKDKAKEIFIEMKAPLYLLEFSENLYNILIKDKRSEAFIWRPYEEIYRRKSPEKLVQGITQTVTKTEAKFKIGRFRKKARMVNKWKELIAELERKKAANEVLVLNATHLVAWNNSSVMKDILVFSFKHIDQEEIVNFDVTDILKCNRERFRASGTHETLCIRFLKNCEMGEQLRVHDYLAFKGIDPNLADAEGNTALITAAVNDQLAVIDVLLDRGADINMCNDEGFTPLGLSVTRYLALKNDVKDWEKTFLRNSGETTYPENTVKWRHQGDDFEDFARSSDSEDKIKIDEARPDSKHKPEDLSEETLIKLAVIKETILKLIDRGAEPNKCVVPMPVFSMAISCGDVEIVTCLLEARFKQEGRIQDAEDLHEALFAVVQMPPDEKMVALCTTLIKYGADPNAKILGTLEEENTFKLCELVEGEKGMKTPLHTVVTRQDGIIYNEYLCAVVKLLLNNNADPDALFFGHTPLSAAIVKGNAGMVKCLMDTSQVDPNQKLGKNLGVPLTVLFAQECARKLPPDNAMCIVDILVNSGAQLLSDLEVENFTGNVIEFAHDELDEFKRQSKKDKSKRGNIHGYQTVVDYVTKHAQQGLINKVKEILWRSSQPFASYGIKVSQIMSASRRADKASLKGARTSSKMKERASSKDALTSSKVIEASSKDALTSSKMIERTSSKDDVTSSKIKERMSSKDALISSKIKDRTSSKDAPPSIKMKERLDKMSSKDTIPSLKTKERVNRYNSKDSFLSPKMKERVDKLSAKEVMPFANKTVSDILKSPPEGLPSWLTAEDIVQIINLIQEKELTRVSREQASFVLGSVLSRDSKDVDQEKLGKLLSLVGGLEGSEDDYKRKKSDRKEQKMTEKQSVKMSGRKSKDRKSWNILTALRRPRAATGTKLSDFQTIDKDPNNSNVCFGCGRNFTKDLLRLCPVCKQVKFCSAECFWKSRKNNSHTCTGDIFPDWKDEPELSEYDTKEGDSYKKNKKATKKISLDVMKKNNDALEDNLYKSEFKNRLEKDWKSTKNVMSGRKSSRQLK